MTSHRTLGLLLAGTAFFSVANAAFALDGNDLLAKLNAAYASQGGTLAATNVTVDGDTVTLEGATMTATGANGMAFPIGTVTMTGVEETDDGYSVEKAAFSDVDFSKDGVNVKATDLSISGLTIPNEVKPGELSSMLLYQSFHSGPITVNVGGKDTVSIEAIDGTVDVADDESKMDFDGTIAGIKADLTSVPDPKAQQSIEALGLQSISGEITMKGSWSLADGKLDITEYAFDFDDIGRLDINFGLSGYTLAFIKSLQDAVKASEANPDKAAAQQALGMSMMGMMAQLS
jgi:hypothetical protein